MRVRDRRGAGISAAARKARCCRNWCRGRSSRTQSLGTWVAFNWRRSWGRRWAAGCWRCSTTRTCVYLLQVGACVLFIVLLLRVRQTVSDAPHEAATLKSLGEGISFVWNKKVVLGAMALDMFAVLLGGARALLPVFAIEILHVGRSAMDCCGRRRPRRFGDVDAAHAPPPHGQGRTDAVVDRGRLRQQRSSCSEYRPHFTCRCSPCS